MDLITPEEMDGLPEGEEAAFAQLEWIIRQRIDNETQGGDINYDITPSKTQYVTIICAAAEEYMIPGFDGFDNEQYSDELFSNVYRSAVSASTRISLRSKRMKALDSVALPQGAKERLRLHIGEIESAL